MKKKCWSCVHFFRNGKYKIFSQEDLKFLSPKWWWTSWRRTFRFLSSFDPRFSAQYRISFLLGSYLVNWTNRCDVHPRFSRWFCLKLSASLRVQRKPGERPSFLRGSLFLFLASFTLFVFFFFSHWRRRFCRELTAGFFPEYLSFCSRLESHCFFFTRSRCTRLGRAWICIFWDCIHDEPRDASEPMRRRYEALQPKKEEFISDDSSTKQGYDYYNNLLLSLLLYQSMYLLVNILNKMSWNPSREPTQRAGKRPASDPSYMNIERANFERFTLIWISWSFP